MYVCSLVIKPSRSSTSLCYSHVICPDPQALHALTGWLRVPTNPESKIWKLTENLHAALYSHGQLTEQLKRQPSDSRIKSRLKGLRHRIEKCYSSLSDLWTHYTGESLSVLYRDATKHYRRTSGYPFTAHACVTTRSASEDCGPVQGAPHPTTSWGSGSCLWYTAPMWPDMMNYCTTTMGLSASEVECALTTAIDAQGFHLWMSAMQPPLDQQAALVRSLFP